MIDLKEAGRIAAMAKLRLDETDVAAMNDMLKILDGIKNITLTDAGPDDLPPSSLREDAGCPSMSREELLRNAPDIEAGCVSVPKILGRDE